MSTKEHFVASGAVPLPTRFEHLVGGGGGSRAILALSGLIYALHKAGFDFKKLKSIGGISGGAIPTLMLANGMKAGRIVLTAVDVDFAQKLTKHGNYLELLFALLMKERYERTRPLAAIFSTEKVAAYIDELVPVWPENYWTMAVHEDKQVLFTVDGAFLCGYDGNIVRISDRPARVSDALCGSMAVPGFIKPPFWNGMHLFDGVLSWDGLCPIGVVVRNFGARANEIIACDVRQQDRGALANWLKESWEAFLGGLPWSREERSPRRFAAEGSLLIEPELNKFGSLKFSLNEGQKWEAVISAFRCTARKLKEHGQIGEAMFAELEALANNPRHFIRDCKTHA